MAQALRTVWLEPEEQQEPLSPQLQPRHKRRPVATVRQGPLVTASMIILVAVAVAFVGTYINNYARIARFDIQRQALNAELRQLTEECDMLKLDVARLENTPNLAVVAKLQNLEYPTADRVHYIQVSSDFPTSAVASTPTRQRSWLAQAGHQMVAKLGAVFQQLSRGPGSPAYAQQ